MSEHSPHAAGRASFSGVSPSSLGAALACRCPRCGEGRLYAGLVRVAERCTRCGLELKRLDTGDGAAAFLIFAIGAIAMALVLYTEFTYEPPPWLHLLLWPPVVTFLTIASLRPAKAFLIAQHWRHLGDAPPAEGAAGSSSGGSAAGHSSGGSEPDGRS